MENMSEDLIKFKETHINLGTVRPGSKHVMEFKYEGELEVNRNIFGRQDIITSCGCASAKHIPQLKIIKVEFTTPDIPVHIQKLGTKTLPTRKSVNVGYKETNKIARKLLTFSAVISKE